jgi:glycosyltransferase involved in cell wall biosynthesis
VARTEKSRAARSSRIGIVCSAELSTWISCRTIVPNLAQAYRKLHGSEAGFYHYQPEMKNKDIIQLAAQIRDDAPARLVFIDHNPHPRGLLVALKALYGKNPLPTMIFHIFGDFTYFSKDWLACEPLLKGVSVQFICASERQAKLISRFLVDTENTVLVCPFPVDTDVYHDAGKKPGGLRKRLGISNSEKVICYTGRLSLQKNVISLARELVRFSSVNRVPFRFLIAGSFDDIGAPFFGIRSADGYYYQQWRTFLNELTPAMKSRIHYLGPLGSEELAEVYRSSDLFTSLSLHHDEDFGMSPAEALCCGIPAVLTDWGGYASFSQEGSCSLLPVKIRRTGLQVSMEDFHEKLGRFLIKYDGTQPGRKERSEQARGRFGIDAVSARIAEIFGQKPSRFAGFNWRMLKYVQANTANREHFPEGTYKDTFYEEIYGVYAGS